MYYYLILSIVAIGALVFQGWLFYKERSQLLSRIMATSFEEYDYHDKMYTKDVKEAEKLRDEARDTRMGEDIEAKEEDEEFKKEKEFVLQLEEDWTGEDIDYDKLKDRLREEDKIRGA